MLIIKNNRIIITKGDTGTIQLSLESINHNVVHIEENDTIKLTVKKLASDPTSLIQLTADETGQFAISPEDTKELNTGVYVYDVQLNREGNIYTVIPQNYFEIRSEITE